MKYISKGLVIMTNNMEDDESLKKYLIYKKFKKLDKQLKKNNGYTNEELKLKNKI